MNVKASLFILFAFLFALSACSSTKSASEAENTKTSKEQQDLVFALLERGYCFGTCNVFSVKIYQSGLIEYEGKANVDHIGLFTGQLSKAELSKIQAVADEINFAKLNDVYDDPNLMDVPGHKSGLLIDGKLKTVYRRVNYPESIKVFEAQIEAAIATTELIPVQDK